MSQREVRKQEKMKKEENRIKWPFIVFEARLLDRGSFYFCPGPKSKAVDIFSLQELLAGLLVVCCCCFKMWYFAYGCKRILKKGDKKILRLYV